MTISITDIWRDQPGRFFCICTKSGAGTFGTHLFGTDEFGKIRQFIKDNADKDIYFCPHGFNRRVRNKEEAELPNLLWADLDEADPRSDKQFHGLKPTILIESSPGRFVGLWVTNKPVTEALNRRLTYHVGADPSGWDTTQLLRYPGTRNYKYSSQPIVRVLWDDGPTYTIRKLNKLLPPEDELGEIDGNDLNPAEVFSQYEKKLPQWVRRELIAKRITGKADRSEMLWKLENACVEAGMSLDEAFAVIKRCPWNKFKDRRNEDEHLRRELSKIVDHHFRAAPGGKDRLKRGSDQEESDEEVGRRAPMLNFQPLADIEAEDIAWIWYPYLARKTVTLWEGDPGLGKSFASMIAFASIACGEKLPSPRPSMPFTSGPVVYFDIENNAGSVTKVRLSYNGFDKLKNYIVVEQAFSIEDPDAQALIYEHLELIRPVAICFDTLNTYIGKADTHKGSEATQAMNWFVQLSKDFDCAVVVIRHLTKSRGSAITAGSGSMSFTGSARIVITFGCHPDDTDTRVMAQAKNNLAPMAKGLTFNINAKKGNNAEFVWGEYTELTADMILAASHEARTKGTQGDHMQDAMEFLESTIAGVAVELSKLIRMGEKRSIDSKLLKRAGSKMNVTIKKKKGEEYWILDKDEEE